MGEGAQNMRLLLPEYGRNVQKMVQWLFTIEDRELRSRQAALVVATMANVYPHKRDTVEFRNMLWDHLFMIAGNELDVDAPFDKPAPDQFSPRPLRIPYGQSYVAQKQYGALIPRMAREVVRLEDAAVRQKIAATLARTMRQKSYDYNNEYPSNDAIVADLYDMTDGAIRLDSSVFQGAQLEVRPTNNSNKKNQQNRGGKNLRNNNNQRNK